MSVSDLWVIVWRKDSVCTLWRFTGKVWESLITYCFESETSLNRLLVDEIDNLMKKVCTLDGDYKTKVIRMSTVYDRVNAVRSSPFSYSISYLLPFSIHPVLLLSFCYLLIYDHFIITLDFIKTDRVWTFKFRYKDILTSIFNVI